MKALIVDISSRSLEVFTGSVTQIPGGAFDRKIVVRHGASLGNAEDIFGVGKVVLDDQLALVVTGTPYRAMSSNGFVELAGEESPFSSVKLVGVCGCFGAKGLRPIAPVPAHVFGPGKWAIVRCETHQNLNEETADSAVAGIEFLARQCHLLAIIEGQSNTTTAFMIGGRPEWDDRRGLGIGGLQSQGGARMFRSEEWNIVPTEHTQWLVELNLPETISSVSAVA